MVTKLKTIFSVAPYHREVIHYPYLGTFNMNLIDKLYSIYDISFYPLRSSLKNKDHRVFPFLLKLQDQQ